eukprot:CAMPEP_0116870784 /NCGR_PEP_ID=MMETSP0463-20121206/856_1 /TAXON_ID=181622 /ORGANISM="Strombidinopsis sp, Strain SopsisLIS2011" /LENGTH=144 /DNA_ID=CAMNT_0004507995 /DNA_START=324 /DNA_END=758 /DNA_ORIENTATION=-
MNANGDERIDHDEFVAFMLQLLLGSFENKLKIVFQLFDFEEEEVMRPESVRLILRHIPIWSDCEHGLMHEECHEMQLTRVALLKEKYNDWKDINQFVDSFFRKWYAVQELQRGNNQPVIRAILCNIQFIPRTYSLLQKLPASQD